VDYDAGYNSQRGVDAYTMNARGFESDRRATGNPLTPRAKSTSSAHMYAPPPDLTGTPGMMPKADMDINDEIIENNT